MNTEMTAHLQRLSLSRSPFPPTPDSTGYFSSPQLERDQVEIGHRLRTRAGIVLLTGEIGTGKTTFLLAGSGAGGKLAQANKLGGKVVDEEAFLVMLQGTKPQKKQEDTQGEFSFS